MASISNERINFDSMYHTFLEEITKTKYKEDIFAEFKKMKSTEEMFSYIWQMEELQFILNFPLVPGIKNNPYAEHLIVAANYFHHMESKYAFALHHYNRSISFADQTIGDTLASAFERRSSLLYNIGAYNESLADIDLAIKHGYSINNSKGVSLIERKAVCLVAIGNNKEANSILADCLNSMSELNLEDSEEAEMKKKLVKTQNKLKTNKKVPNPVNTNIFKIFHPEAPPVKESQQYIPALDTCVKLTDSVQKERHILAKRDILPGEIILSEKCLSASALALATICDYCSLCFKKVLNPLPCPSCTKAMFCNESCLKEAMNKFHAVECHIYPTMLVLDITSSTIGSIIVRLLAELGLSYLKENIPKYKDEDKIRSMERKGFNDAREYLSHDYRTVYSMLMHLDERSGEDVFKNCVRAAFLVKLLQLSGNFFDKDDPNNYDDDVLCGATVLRHFLNFQCNSFKIIGYVLNSKYMHYNKLQVLAVGIFPALSFFNHSCSPNTIAINYGKSIILKATKFIPSLKEVTVSYGPLSYFSQREMRRIQLYEQYYFNCHCEACIYNWPLAPDLSHDLQLRCLTCEKFPVEISSGRCSSCFSLYPSAIEVFGVVYNVKSLYRELHRAVREFKKVYDLFSRRPVVSTSFVEVLEKTIKCLYNYILPCQALYCLEETIRHCYISEGWVHTFDGFHEVQHKNMRFMIL